MLENVLERRAAETRRLHAVKWPVGTDADAVGDFLGGCGDGFARHEVEASKFVGRAVERPGVTWRAVFLKGKGVEGGRLMRS